MRSALRPSRSILILLGAAAIGVVALRVASSGDRAGEPLADARPREGLPSVLSYDPRPAEYEVEWQTEATIDFPQVGPQTTSVLVEAVVDVRRASAAALDNSVVVLRLRSVKRAQVAALGQDLPDVPAQLDAQEMLLSLYPDGTVQSVSVLRDATPLAKNLLQALALHFAFTLPTRRDDDGKTSPGPDPAPYVATEPGDHGPIVWAYTVHGNTLQRSSRDPFVRGDGLIEFSGAIPRHIEQSTSAKMLRGERTVASTRGRFVAKLVQLGAAPLPTPDFARFESHAPEERPTATDERAANLTLANGMTIEDVVAMIGAYTLGNPPLKGNITRAAALLRAEPASCERLRDPFLSEATNQRGRELLIDILTSSGDETAERLVRELVSSSVARKDRSAYESYLQRLSFLPAPRAESIAFVEKEWRTARQSNERRIRQAAAYTLGSLAGQARVSGHDDLAAPVVALLLRTLREPKDEDEERGLLAALGNAGDATSVNAIVERASRPDDRTRSQAATALRKFHSPEVRALLVKMTTDTDPRVATSAIRSLDAAQLGTPELAALAGLAEGGKLNDQSYSAIVALATAHPVDKRACIRILRAIAARSEGRAELLDQVERGLRDLEAAERAAVPGTSKNL